MADFTVSLETLLEAGCHFGHQARRWNPKMGRYIHSERGGVHIFDLAKTSLQLQEACEYLAEAAKNGKTVVFVGTKRQAQSIIRTEAGNAGAGYITNRWPGGLITNWEQVGKSVAKLNKFRAGKETGEFSKYTKKENVLIDREITRLDRFFGGVAFLTKIPDVLVVVDINKELVAVKEAIARGVFVIAIADSNTDPDLANIAIPGNDDAVGSIQLLVEKLAGAYKSGKQQVESK
ncbi:MAG TPA: 30S ribosomal protein S2 [Patescibacteria group bacterium]|nr:30S ribosomal protein S2 [Patescibacteria group bacterium]